ncbi:glycosyltransferase family 4 protein [Mesorhizobium sp. BAC0120]|uniref:glycosyltransferase family 4 protein n=1 Tax=Mesorhizobium sp. BAC0120 TaxID=3090670 RepID=UPI00298CB124|nr:glycosyltransferase family 4 protein [Mesorhizobium sp. BAC0120]MDW6023596.1 glycosyltransferase family 4 protein [Mesorhizobium sp. BAC0120]
MLQSLMRKRRILMTVDAVGGVWRYAIDLAGGLTQRGHSIVLVGVGPGPSDDQRREAERIGALVWLQSPLDWTVENEDSLEDLPAELTAVAHEHGVDLVHLNAPSQACGLEFSCPVVAVSHSCVVTWFHTVKTEAPPAPWEWQKRRNRRGFDRADAVIAPSASHAVMLEACYGPIAGLEVVHNASRAVAKSAAREHVILAASRWWDEGKNGGVLDEAASLCRWPVFAAGATIGPNGQSTSFSDVVGLGELAGEEVRALMARAAIFVSPSIFEPFGLAALEAAMAETPLVLSDIATYRELWDGAAVFFPPLDSRALAVILNEIAGDEGLRLRLGRAARRRAKEYSAERQLARMQAVYDLVEARVAVES